MMPHTHKNIVKETGLIPYATWDLGGDYSTEIVDLLNENGVLLSTTKPTKDTSIIIDIDKEKPYATVISLATKDNKSINKDAERAFRSIDDFAESLPHLEYTIFYGHAKELKDRIAEEKKSLASKI